MDILYTAIALVILTGCVLSLTRAERIYDRLREIRDDIEVTCAKIAEERSRLTGLERDVDALRRELRKVAGKFYASQREIEDEEREWVENYEANVSQHAIPASICDNWTAAQREGPQSEAASCECAYCVGRRAERRAFRAAAVPKTVQAQGEMAKLNAGKP